MYSLPATLKRKPLVSALLAALLFTAATDQVWAEQGGIEKAKGRMLKIHEVATILLQQGFYDIREIEFENHIYEINAHNTKGKKVEIDMDSVSGKILTIKDD